MKYTFLLATALITSLSMPAIAGNTEQNTGVGVDSTNKSTNSTAVDSTNTAGSASGVNGSGNSSNLNAAGANSSAVSGQGGTGLGIGQGGSSASTGIGAAVSGDSLSGSQSAVGGQSTTLNQTENAISKVKQEASDIPIQLAPLPPNTNPTASVVCKYLQAQLSYVGGKSGGISVFNFFGIQGSKTPDKLPEQQKGILQAIATCGVVDQINSLTADMPVERARAIKELAIERLFHTLKPISGYEFRPSDITTKEVKINAVSPARTLSNYQNTLNKLNAILDKKEAQ